MIMTKIGVYMNKYIVLLLMFATSIHAQYVTPPIIEAYYSSTHQMSYDEIYALKKPQNSPMNTLIVDSYLNYLVGSLVDEAHNKKLPKEWRQKIEKNYQEMLDFEKNHTVNSEFYSVMGDLAMLLAGQGALAEMIKMVKLAREYFHKSIEMDKNFVPPYINLATFYYFAPKIGGGDVNKSLEYLAQATPKTPAEKFQVLVWRSQMYFRLKQKDKTEQDLQQASEIFPHNAWLKEVKEFNAKNKHFE